MDIVSQYTFKIEGFMNIELKNRFIEKWEKFFPGAELPITFYFTEISGGAEIVPPAKAWKCIIGELMKVRRGTSLCFNSDAIGCRGGKRYTSLSQEFTPDFRYFLSCGIEGKMEGERYKRNPEIVDEIMKAHRDLGVTGKNIVFKRWDNLEESDDPEVAIFFGHADVLSGLFTLANFDRAFPDGVITPFGSGCSSIVYHPYIESKTDQPRGVIGMFDVSARPYVGEDILTFAVPMKRFEQMINYMDESFLVTEVWSRVQKRISKKNQKQDNI
jgi:hypothetical protein